VDVPYQWLYYIFEEDDDEIKRIGNEYSSGKLLTGEVKKILAQKVNQLLEKHREKRERSEEMYSTFLYDGKLARIMWDKIHS